jgi:hypothetical protein
MPIKGAGVKLFLKESAAEKKSTQVRFVFCNPLAVYQWTLTPSIFLFSDSLSPLLAKILTSDIQNRAQASMVEPLDCVRYRTEHVPHPV